METTDEKTTLTVEQAKAILAQPPGTFSFRNLVEVDLEVARVLSQYKGELRLNGLTHLSPEVALALSDQPKGANLCLNGLTELSPEAAKALATRPGGMLSLNALTSVSPQVARELSNVKGKLTLNGVTQLSVESARELAKHRSKLTLFTLPEISDEAAAALAEHRGTFLLNGLTRLSSPVLVESMLQKNDGFLGFKKVEKISDGVAEVLVAYDGKKAISLDGLTEVPAAHAASLRANKNIVLPAHLQKPGITNSLGMRLAYITAGTFAMGSPRDEPGRESQEQRHSVELTKDFYLGVHEVTVGQFREFVRESGYQTEAERDGKGSWGITATGKFEQDAKYNWKAPGFDQTDDHPVVDVSWNDAKAFCQWLSEKEKRTYRLPTEAVWEYACRAGTHSAYAFGDDPQNLMTSGNVADATARAEFPAWSLGIKGTDGHAYTAPVGQFKPNRFGLFDMHGNVWEWCEDWFDENAYGNTKRIDPTGPDSGSKRVHRGGGWSSAPERCRSASRVSRDHSTYRGCYLGFRVVLEPLTE
ncbi:formylglycine-generating enzyme family protein [Lignipirellula cremea]|nr:formylglycine-generating enzyme family protein [Lignipirellula cremea]